MTATCEVPLGICPETEGFSEWDAERIGFDKPFGPVSRTRVQREPVLWANVFNALSVVLLDAAIKRFVDAVSSVPQVEEVVLFNDEDGTHLWTALSCRDWDAETAVLAAHSELRRAYSDREIDLFVLACRADELDARLPSGFVRLYAAR